MTALPSAEWQTLMDAWRRVESSQQTGQGVSEAWQEWRVAVIAWQKIAAGSGRTVRAERNEGEHRRRG